MKKSCLYILLSLITLVVSCDKESPFEPKQETGHGQIMKSALGIDLRDEEMTQTRAASDIDLDDFKITFTKVGASTPSGIYRYGEMPEIVTLEKGSYTVRAEYGDDVEADWNSPYYAGESDTFTINPDEITDDIGDIVCRLQNVKVTIDFAPILTEQMSDDSAVEVRVSGSGTADDSKYLRFSKNDQIAGNAGYFRHVEGVSLVATFRGMVEGLQTVQTKSYAQVQKGYHYKITFKLNTQSGESRGDVTGALAVDATVTVTDVERNVDVEDDVILDDNERPREEDPEKPDPGTPDTPTVWDGPSVTVDKPLQVPAMETLKPENGVITIDCAHTIPLDKIDDEEITHVLLNFKSLAGFDEFYADIDSPNLTPDELAGVGLSDHLDLVQPESESLAGALQGLGLPVYIGGEHIVAFDISRFMGLLAVFGENEHTFRIHAKDKDGELVVNLVLTFK